MSKLTSALSVAVTTVGILPNFQDIHVLSHPKKGGHFRKMIAFFYAYQPLYEQFQNLLDKYICEAATEMSHLVSLAH